MKAVRWLVVLLLLAGAAGAHAAPDADGPAMPDPCRPAPNLPFCK